MGLFCLIVNQNIGKGNIFFMGSGVNLLQRGVAYLYPLKTSENVKVF